MPDIIEENDGEGMSQIERRAQAVAHAHAMAARARRSAAILAAAAANVNNNNGNNNANIINNNNAAAVEGNAPNNDGNNNNVNAADGGAAAAAEQVAEVAQIAGHMARLVNDVDVRPMFRRLGVRNSFDLRYIRERDLDGLARITPIQKRKLWAIMRYVSIADANHALTGRTTLSDITKALNLNKKKEKESSTSASTGATVSAATTAAFTAGTKLQSFDGSHSHWVIWKNKSRYSLAQTPLGALVQENLEEGKKYASKHPNQDCLLFNILAEAIVGGSANHLIRKVETKELPAIANKPKKTRPASAAASGHVLWELLVEEYSQGPRAFWILSDARQALKQLRLVAPQTGGAGSETSSDASMVFAITQRNNRESESGNTNDEFVTYSADTYAQRFRAAKDTLEEYKQALPESFLASTFVEHIADPKFEDTKKQLLQDVATKNLSLDACVTELLMSEHMLRAQKVSSSNTSSSQNRKRKSRSSGGDHQGRRKRALEDDQGSPHQDDTKRPKLEDADGDNEGHME